MTDTCFCKKCNISKSTYYKVLNNAEECSLMTLIKIALLMKIQFEDLFVYAREILRAKDK